MSALLVLTCVCLQAHTYSSTICFTALHLQQQLLHFAQRQIVMATAASKPCVRPRAHHLLRVVRAHHQECTAAVPASNAAVDAAEYAAPCAAMLQRQHTCAAASAADWVQEASPRQLQQTQFAMVKLQPKLQ
jgi:hypothetical protein